MREPMVTHGQIREACDSVYRELEKDGPVHAMNMLAVSQISSSPRLQLLLATRINKMLVGSNDD
jgi:hypothetical protein